MEDFVLSIFPGIDLLGRAFEEEGFCVVRGPDVIWGGDIRNFHPPVGVFDGVIGGPPCKGESNLAHLTGGRPGQSLKGEFHRIVEEAQPIWWVMEAVVKHKAPYVVKLSPRWLGEMQSRRRYFHSNLDIEPYIEITLFENPVFKYAVRAANRASGQGTIRRRMASYSWHDMCKLQGLPADFELPQFTKKGAQELVGNGVPMPMGRAIARAVKCSREKT